MRFFVSRCLLPNSFETARPISRKFCVPYFFAPHVGHKPRQKKTNYHFNFTVLSFIPTLLSPAGHCYFSF